MQILIKMTLNDTLYTGVRYLVGRGGVINNTPSSLSLLSRLQDSKT